VKAGTTFDCTIQLAGGESETATLKILNSNADVELTQLKPEAGTDKLGVGSKKGNSGNSATAGGSSAEQRSAKGNK
jgi:hypothetical protein